MIITIDEVLELLRANVPYIPSMSSVNSVSASIVISITDEPIDVEPTSPMSPSEKRLLTTKRCIHG